MSHAAATQDPGSPPTTPDRRYIVVRGRLWRTTNPGLAPADRERLVKALMDARRQLRGIQPEDVRERARAAVHAAKVALGERGPVWWIDGAPDLNRHLVKNTPYAAWFAELGSSGPNDGVESRSPA